MMDDLIVIIETTLNTINSSIKNIKDESYRNNLFGIMSDLKLEFEEYSKQDYFECSKLVIKSY